MRAAELVQRSALDLAHALAGKPHDLANLPQGLGLVVIKAKPQLEHLAFSRRQLGECIAQRA